MGLLITNQISTNAGTSTEAYLNISEINIARRANIRVKTNLYLSLQDKIDNPNNTVISKAVYSTIHLDLSETFVDVEEIAIYELAYSKLKELLIESGLTVEDSIESVPTI
jgi:hypothetical protein